MTAKRTIILAGLLVPLVAAAGALDIYGSLEGKTILMPTSLPAVSDSVVSDLPSERTNAITTLEDRLSENGIVVVPDGPHFVRLVPRTSAANFATNAPLRGAELARKSGVGTLAAGTINLVNADSRQVLAIYASLAQRTILRPLVLPYGTVRLRTQSALSRDEAIYALTTLLAFNGIAVVEDGDKFAQVVAGPQRAQVRLRAPRPSPEDKVINPQTVPSLGTPSPTKPTTKLERDLERLRKVVFDFLHYQGPRARQAGRLLEFYADLAEKTAIPSEKFDGGFIEFSVTTPLTRAELLYAVETTFALNNLAIVPVGTDKVRLGHITELGGDSGRPGQ